MNQFLGIIDKADNFHLPSIRERIVAQNKYAAYRTVAHHRARNAGFIGFSSHEVPETTKEQAFFFDEGDRYCITADARIDNRDELIAALDLSGDVIPDSLLILEAYKQWGEDCPAKLLGDFAFALWDKKGESLFCARDRVGVKPFYYSFREGLFVFSSILSFIFSATEASKKPHLETMKEFLSHLYVTSSETTFFQDVNRLPAGSYLIYREGSCSIKNYWRLDEISMNNGSLKENSEKFLHLFTEAVRCRLQGRAPAGLSLSGGLDSTAIALIASSVMPVDRLISLSLRFEGMKCDEGKYISEIIHKTGMTNLPINALSEELKTAQALESYYRLNSDWPAMQFHGLYLHLLNRAGACGVKTLLTGWGGDQVCQGSLYYLADFAKSFRLVSLYNELRIYNSLNLIRGDESEQVWFYLLKNYILKPLTPQWMKNIRHAAAGRSAAPERKAEGLPPQRVQSHALNENIAMVQGPVAQTWTEGVYCQLAIASGIELLHPFLDSRLIEFMLTVPEEQKIYSGDSKIILKQALKDSYPQRLLVRKDKAFFKDFLVYLINSYNKEFVMDRLSLLHLGLVGEKELTIIKDFFSKEDKEGVMKHLNFIDRFVNLEYWYNANFS